MSNDTNKIKIWNYVKKEKRVNIHQIATELNLTEKDVLVAVESLQKDKYIKPIVLPLNGSSECSCYYSITDKNWVY